MISRKNLSKGSKEGVITDLNSVLETIEAEDEEIGPRVEIEKDLDQKVDEEELLGKDHRPKTAETAIGAVAEIGVVDMEAARNCIQAHVTFTDHLQNRTFEAVETMSAEARDTISQGVDQKMIYQMSARCADLEAANHYPIINWLHWLRIP